jgi:hypothetical protein
MNPKENAPCGMLNNNKIYGGIMLSTDSPTDIETILAGCERDLAAGGKVDLRKLGFWRAVSAVKRRREWTERYADRIGAIDRQAFERAVRPTWPPAVGTSVLSLGAAAGLFLAGVSRAIPSRWNAVTLMAGATTLLGTTHGLAHFVLGRLLGIRFTHWYLNGPTRLQPGVKIDYASYLRASPQARAWMHASGALVTKVIPFALVPVARTTGMPRWAAAALLGIGVAQIGTDLLYSTRKSDWKRVRREVRIAQQSKPKADRTPG